jgi:hypothetical protein
MYGVFSFCAVVTLFALIIEMFMHLVKRACRCGGGGGGRYAFRSFFLRPFLLLSLSKHTHLTQT